MAQQSPSRAPREPATAASDLAIRLPTDEPPVTRQVFYVSNRPSRNPSPLQNTHKAVHDQLPPPDTRKSPVDLPPSPSRLKGLSGDRNFDSIKAAASKHALLEKSREQANARARQDRTRPQMIPPSPSRDRSLSPRPALASLGSDLRPDLGKRHASADSTSSISQTQSQHISPAEAPETVDVPALIAAAGSPEAAIMKLLQDKHVAAQNNAQLWRLMNKQRQMMADLNKDLQKVTKEKDRYRRKLKEQYTASASLSTLTRNSSLALDREDLHSPTISNLVHDPLTAANAEDDFEDRAAALPSGASPMHAKPMAAPFPTQAQSPAALRSLSSSTRASENRPQSSALGDIPARGTENQTSVQVTRPSGEVVSRLGSFSSPNRDRVSSLSRKAPPAPLDLAVHKALETTLEFSPDAATPSNIETAKDQERPEPVPLERDISMSELSVISEGRCSSPEELGSPKVAKIQTYQSLNALNAVLKTPLASPNPHARQEAGGAKYPNRPAPRPDDIPQTPLSATTPQLAQARQLEHVDHQESDKATVKVSPQSNRLATPLLEEPPVSAALSQLPTTVYKGFVSPEWPDLLLPPASLSAIQIKVESSRLRPSRNSYLGPKASDEVSVVTLAVCSKSSDAQLWRLEKTLQSLSLLDNQIRAVFKLQAKLPDRGLFVGHAPARIDARRTALASYFINLLETPLPEQAAKIVCAFLSQDAFGADQDLDPLRGGSTVSTQSQTRSTKDGYLTKKGKNFGGWKARFFALDGPTLKYFEAPGGAQLGAIKILHASIGRQTTSTQDEVDEENQYRHAFVILEQKRRDRLNHVKHVLCAESDEERDAWVHCLLQWTEPEDTVTVPKTPKTPKLEKPQPSPSPSSSSLGDSGGLRQHKSMNDMRRAQPTTPTLQEMPGKVRAVMYDSTIAAEAPVMLKTPLVTPSEEAEHRAQLPVISGPINGAKIQDAGTWGNKRDPTVLIKDRIRRPDAPPERPKERKRSIFAFSGKLTTETGIREGASQKEDATPPHPVFGIALAEAVEYCAPTNVNTQLPAVVYRCLEYLRAKDAMSEEGIFRMSGSNIVVRSLRERFNTEGDIQLLAPNEQTYDIHAVASLLKMYLRELPTPILTRDLHLDFVKCLDLDDKTRCEAFNVLANRLPSPNREVLDQICGFLREIVDNERVNKMNVRNVGIVFAPTLNIPAPLISFLVLDHARIFGPPVDIWTVEDRLPTLLSSSGSTSSAKSLATDGSRSPGVRDPLTPASDASFGKGGDYSVMQRIAKDAYDIGYAPAPLNIQPRSRQPSGAPGEDTSHDSPKAQFNHTSFHSMQFPDPPLSSSTKPSPQPDTNSSHSSASTLTGALPRQSSSAWSSSDASDTPSDGNSPAMAASRTFSSLNDISISSSPLMGGTSPEFGRSGFSPHIGASQQQPWQPTAHSNLSASQSAAAIASPNSPGFDVDRPPMPASVSGPVGPAPASSPPAPEKGGGFGARRLLRRQSAQLLAKAGLLDDRAKSPLLKAGEA